MFLKAPSRPWRGDLEGRSSDFPENLCVNIGVDPTLSLESCAAPPEAVSTASPPSPQLLEQEERPSNRRARETYVHIARDEVRDLTAGAASPFKWPHSTIKRANAPHSTVNRTNLALLTKHVQVLTPWSIELQQMIFTRTDMKIERFGGSGYYNCRNDIKAILGVRRPELKDELRWAGRRDQVIDRAALSPENVFQASDNEALHAHILVQRAKISWSTKEWRKLKSRCGPRTGINHIGATLRALRPMQTVDVKDLLLALEKWDDEIRKHEEGTGAAMLNEVTKNSVGSGASTNAENITSFLPEFWVRVFLSRCLSRLPFSVFFKGIWLTATSQSIRPL